MIAVALSGGIGNQLFQYAFGRALAVHSRQGLWLCRRSFQTDYLQRQYLLHHFRVQATTLPPFISWKLLTPGTRAFRVLDALHLIGVYEENDFSYKTDAVPDKFIHYFKGHWQSHRYFSGIRMQLLQELVLSEPIVQKLRAHVGTTGEETVCVHVRRKEYLADQRYGFLGEDYYHRALKLMSERVVNARYLIFSDDMDWCRKQFEGLGPLQFVTRELGLKDYEELMMMTLCHHHIVANSSFSWWGAWLCQHPSQVVVRPADPFRDPSLYYEDYYPDHWLTVSNT